MRLSSLAGLSSPDALAFFHVMVFVLILNVCVLGGRDSHDNDADVAIEDVSILQLILPCDVSTLILNYILHIVLHLHLVLHLHCHKRLRGSLFYFTFC